MQQGPLIRSALKTKSKKTQTDTHTFQGQSESIGRYVQDRESEEMHWDLLKLVI